MVSVRWAFASVVCVACGGKLVEPSFDDAATTPDAPSTFDAATPVTHCTATTATTLASDQRGYRVALDDAYVYWVNRVGQLGLGGNQFDNSPHPTPAQVVGVSNVTAISAGSWSVCAIEADRSVWCWGQNTYDELGHDNSTDLACGGNLPCDPTPTRVPTVSCTTLLDPSRATRPPRGPKTPHPSRAAVTSPGCEVFPPRGDAITRRVKAHTLCREQRSPSRV